MSSEAHIIETALRVLVAWTSGVSPAPADLDVLRTAFPSLATLPSDELACRVVHDLCGRELRELDGCSPAKPPIDEVA
jgi:hypothetical protein